MKKNKSIFIFIAIIIVIILFVWVLSKNSIEKKELTFVIKSSNIDLQVGGNLTIDYELSENVNISWKSDNNDVAVVNNGIITGVGLGNTFIHGTVTYEDKTITRECMVSTYQGSKNISLEEIIVPDGELFITKGDSYQIDINYNPIDAYIKSIEYSSLNENISSFTNGLVKANNVGSTNVMVKINNTILKSVTVNVIEKNITPTFSNRVNNVEIEQSEITIKPNETKEIIYTITPSDGFIESIKWESTNNEIASVTDGIITGKSSGETIVKMIVNDEITKEIKVIVSIPVTGISLKSNSKIVLKVGKQAKINTEIVPSNATNKKIEYTSSSSNINIDSNGIVTAISAGSGNITVKSVDGNHKLSIPYIINPIKGIVSGDGGIWKYNSSNDKPLSKADTAFFQKLASSGKGVLSNGVYTYTDSNKTYKYNIGNSTLNVGGRNILMRIYYPTGVDLSTANTFTFLGGAGERSFSGYYNDIDKNPSMISSSGIVILVSARSSYDAEDGMYSTDFLRGIVDQKAGVKNTVGGYSMSGNAAGGAAEKGIYDRLILFDSYYDYSYCSTSLKNKEIVIYSPVGDALTKQTKSTLNEMIKYNFTNVTLVSNNQELVNRFSPNILVINPGDPMGKGHASQNILTAKVFAFACS